MAPFSLGIGYWPRRRAGAEQILCSWSECDQGALRDELAHIAELGCDTVRLELRWAEVQPGPARLHSAALRGIERALDLAHDRGLRAAVALMGGTLGGALHLPDWAVGLRLPDDPRKLARFGPPVLTVSADQRPILTDVRYRREPARDLYGEPELRAAQGYLLREAAGNLSRHPALAGWVIAPGVERARRAVSAQAAADWWRALADRARSLGAPALYGQIDAAGLLRRDSLRPEAIHAAGGRLLVSAAPLPPLSPRRPWEAAAPLFLHALTAGLLQAEAGGPVPVIVADIGVATAAEGYGGWVEGEAFGRLAPIFLADEEQQAQLVEAALAGLHGAGAAGAWLAAYADPGAGAWGIPPLDRSWLPRSWGIIAADGREKPAAEALRRFAARKRAGALPEPVGPPALPIDPERYWRDPAGEFRALAGEGTRGQGDEGIRG